MAQNAPGPAAGQAVFKTYCVTCHNTRLNTAGVALDSLDLNAIAGNAGLLEKVFRKVKTGQMPPAGMPRPNAAAMAGFSK